MRSAGRLTKEAVSAVGSRTRVGDAAYRAGRRDPADRVIVATARVHRLRLLTSDMRIIESKLAPVVD